MEEKVIDLRLDTVRIGVNISGQLKLVSFLEVVT